MTVRIVLFPHPALFVFFVFFTRKGKHGSVSAAIQCSVSGTEIGDALRNTACSWLASLVDELVVSFIICL